MSSVQETSQSSFPSSKTTAPLTDSRTRNYAYSRQYSHKGSSTTTGSSNFGDGSAARIFEHRRDPATNELQNREVTEVSTPGSFHEILSWFDGLLNAARHSPGSAGDRSSRVCLLFLDEKKCEKKLHEEFPMTKLQERLKIDDWCPAHYMSAFCRFPTPLDIHDEEEEEAERIWEWRYSISHPFDWDMLWVYLPTTRTSLGIVRTWFDGYDTNFVEMEQAVVSFPGPTLAHPMLLGLVTLQILTGDTMMNVRDKGNRLFEAQKLTGFHNYNRLRETDALDSATSIGSDLGLVTREILGASSNLTGWENAASQLGSYAKFVADETRRVAASDNPCIMAQDGPSRRLSKYLVHQSQKLSGDLAGALHDAQAWLETAQFLLQGVLNLVSTHDANVNISLARDSKKIAEESKRDSTSMTAIAVVTMFFLPGTFTASFFTLPFFEDQLKELGAGHFWMYWAVTVPLTLATLMVWFIWTRFINPPVDKKNKTDFVDTKRPNAALRIRSLKILSRRSTAMMDKAINMD